MLKPNSVHVAIHKREHLLSAWVRHSIRVGFSYGSFDRCRTYWGMPNQHIKPQRILSEDQECIIERISQDEDTKNKIRISHTNLALWSISEASVSNIQASQLTPSNLEKNVFSFATSWKLCKMCSMEDREKHGFSYWHRNHQLASVTHCDIHKICLLSSESLRSFDRLILPADACNESFQKLSPEDEAQQLYSWSEFVYAIDACLRKNPHLVAQWKPHVRQSLDLPAKVKQTDRKAFGLRSNQLVVDVGEHLMRHLFRAYKNNQARKPCVLWVTLSGWSRTNTIRHPVYWLIILYWVHLRNPLPGVDDYDYDYPSAS